MLRDDMTSTILIGRWAEVLGGTPRRIVPSCRPSSPHATKLTSGLADVSSHTAQGCAAFIGRPSRPRTWQYRYFRCCHDHSKYKCYKYRLSRKTLIHVNARTGRFLADCSVLRA